MKEIGKIIKKRVMGNLFLQKERIMKEISKIIK
jgi:hypothetical protein